MRVILVLMGVSESTGEQDTHHYNPLTCVDIVQECKFMCISVCVCVCVGYTIYAELTICRLLRFNLLFVPSRAVLRIKQTGEQI